jgi:hypothetical protein
VKKKTRMPSFLWANRINLSGLYSIHPVKIFAPSKKDLASGHWDPGYWDRDGDFGVSGDKILIHKGANCDCLDMLNVDYYLGNITAFSKNRLVVLAWTKGVQDTMQMMRNWTKSSGVT